MVALILGGLLLIGGRGAQGASWPRAFVRALSDDAFAVVVTGPDGRRHRHLPHHGPDGQVDPAHLWNALARLGQVHWADPADAEHARRHLEEHLRSLRRAAISTRGGHRPGSHSGEPSQLHAPQPPDR